MSDRTATTEPLTIGQQLVARWEGLDSGWSEPADLAEAIDAAIGRARMEDGMMIDALRREVSHVREKLATVHRLMCEVSARLNRTSRGDDKDVDAAYSKIELAIRVGA